MMLRVAAAFGLARRLALPLFAASLLTAAACSDRGGAIAPEEPRTLAELGRRIFEDTRLSEPPGVACASCHDPRQAFQGNNGYAIPAVAAGSRPGMVGRRNTPSLLYAAFSPPFGFIEDRDEKTGAVEMIPAGGQFWDSRTADLAAQVEGPLLDPREMNNPSKAAVVAKVAAGPCAGLARAVLGAGAFDDPDTAFRRLAEAVAAYESTPLFSPFNAKFDAFLRGTETLTAEEAPGFALFKDPEKGNCISCHVGKEDSRDPRDWLFTDSTYDALGAPRNRALPVNADPRHFDPGLCRRPGLAALAPKDFEVESVCGAFKVPTLRNVAVTAPYMHNGVFDSLRDAVAFYFTRDTKPQLWYPGGRKFDDLLRAWHGNVNTDEVPYDRRLNQRPRATEAEVDALVAFLRTLTDRPAR